MQRSVIALVGGYGADAGGTAAGIGLARLGAGPAEFLGVIAELPAPSWLVVRGPELFAVDEVLNEVHSFRVESGWLSSFGSVRLPGTSNCHLAFDGELLVACSYGDGLVSWLPVEDGVAGPPIRVLEFTGSGPHADQSVARAHSTLALGDGRVLIADLGSDRVRVVTNHGEQELGAIELPAGTGPRDLALLPDGRILVLGEFGGLAILGADEPMPRLVGVTATPWIGPDDHAAGIALLTDGSVVTGIRGSDLLARLRVEQDHCTRLATARAGVGWPRHLLAVGDLVHVAGQGSASIATLELGSDGELRQLGVSVVPTPSHVVLGQDPAWATLADLLG